MQLIPVMCRMSRDAVTIPLLTLKRSDQMLLGACVSDPLAC
jgi:hypothetical protein